MKIKAKPDIEEKKASKTSKIKEENLNSSKISLIEAINIDTKNKYDAVLVAAPGFVAGADSSFPFESSGIASLATSLEKEGFSVGILDADNCNLTRKQLHDRLLAVTADFIGFTSFQNTISDVLDLAKAYKDKYSDSTICLGGYHASFTAKEILEHEKYVDLVVVGKGDEIIGELVANYKKDKVDKSIVYGNMFTRCSNLESKQNWQWRNEEVIRKTKAVAIHTSTGCLCNCSFCSEPAFQKLRKSGTRAWIGRPVSDVIDEISYLHNEFGVELFDFHDPDFLSLTKDSWARASDLAKAIKALPFKPRVRFAAQARAIVKTNSLDNDFWENWKQAGLERVFVGFEAGDDSVLKSFNKASTRAHNFEVIDILRKHDIALQIGFITFTPDISAEELRESISFLKQIGVAHHFRYFANELIIYPGTREFKKLQSENRLKYDRLYLDIEFQYKHDIIGQIAEAAKSAFKKVSNFDKLIWDIEFALASHFKKLRVDSVYIDLDEAKNLYDYLRSTREDSICRCFHEALAGDVKTAFNDFVERDNQLYKEILSYFVKK